MRKGRLEIGLQLLSPPGQFQVYSVLGRQQQFLDRRELNQTEVLMIFVNRGQSKGRQDFVREVGMGSRRQVVGLEFVTSSDITCSSKGEDCKTTERERAGVVKCRRDVVWCSCW